MEKSELIAGLVLNLIEEYLIENDVEISNEERNRDIQEFINNEEIEDYEYISEIPIIYGSDYITLKDKIKDIIDETMNENVIDKSKLINPFKIKNDIKKLLY